MSCVPIGCAKRAREKPNPQIKKKRRSCRLVLLQLLRKMSRRRNWTFVVNNPEEKDWDEVHLLPYKHLAFTLEEEETVHIQGCVHMKKDYTFSRMKKFLPRAHLKAAYHYVGAVEYATKQDHTALEGSYEYGKMPEQGKRMCDDLVTAISEGTPRMDLAKGFSTQWMQLQRGIDATYDVFTPPRDFQTNVTYVYGVSGVGKTTWANLFPSVYSPAPPKNGAYWFNGYEPMEHDTIVFDEFWGKVELSVMNRFLHEHAERCETKGGMKQFRPKYIVITSNLHPEQVYKNVFADFPQAKETWLRRLHNIVEITDKGYILRKGKTKERSD